jgi:hypothetical protein
MNINEYTEYQMSRWDEAKVHEEVCYYIKDNYPDVIFHSDGSGVFNKSWKIKSSISKLKSSKGIPDLHIDEPRNGYAGLKIEIKKAKTPLFTKAGKPYSEHIGEQAKMLERLEEKGYKAVFGVGYQQCIEIIDNYLK